ncbi:related to PTA1 - pre-tRNA processing protein / PF I subunit [Cephalotrichum gorgonifer]|uniref:Related to PTA1 - pre-tRNA processing protein / PF I subunit n=1 Tax=Cephalotrichum gorgonifer TaxID=2041049 RepID=A0AAE8MXE4_9PEZI|nr:related to PTA1 - pre-tRNA processing protein / PF I subunit [Cephalotrichum gorgonifer]
MASPLSVSDHIRQLNDARRQVLGDVKLYQSVVRAILPILAPTSTSHLELRRWTAEFLADTFATPALPSKEKESMQPFVLDTVQSILENPDEDVQVLRSMIQTAASIYPIALRWIIENSYDKITWERMAAVKSRILQMWDNANPSIRICCIKFAQRVVLSQSQSSPAEPRRGDMLDISLDKIPSNHALLDPRTMEAEGVGLLDRILGVLQDNSSDALVVNATLNCLPIIVRTRPNTSARILNTVLNFNPMKLASSPMTAKDRVQVKSMEKTTRMFLIHLVKRDPHNPQNPRIHQQIERLMRMKTEAFDEAAKKRVLDPHHMEISEAKRPKTSPVTAAAVPQQQQEIPPLGPGPHTLGSVFTLTPSEGLRSFDVGIVPMHLAARIDVSTLVNIDAQAFDRAIQAVRDRLLALEATPPVLNPNTALLGVEEDDDEYEPDFYAAEDTEQILNKLDSAPGDLKPPDNALQLEAFTLPPAPQLTTDSAIEIGNVSITQLFEQMKSHEDPTTKKARPGFNRFASSFGDRDSAVTLLIRLATRPQAGLGEVVPKKEDEDRDHPSASLSDHIRSILHTYIVDDFRKRIDVAVAWLCEEWLNDKLQAESPANYEKLVLKLLDGFLPYLHRQDKVLTRFLAEIPELSEAILSRVKQICRDPTVVGLALTSLLYIIMMKPPARELALDTLEEIRREYEDARPTAEKYLTKFRPTWRDKHDNAGDNTGDNTGVSAVPVAVPANGAITT